MIKNIYDSELDTYCELGKAQERIDRLRGIMLRPWNGDDGSAAVFPFTDRLEFLRARLVVCMENYKRSDGSVYDRASGIELMGLIQDAAQVLREDVVHALKVVLSRDYARKA